MTNLVKTTTVAFSVPFAIQLPNGTYPVKGENYFCRVNLTLKNTQNNASGWHGNPQIPNDRFGHTNFTEVLVQFSTDNPKVISDEIPKATRKFALDAINRILDSCRWVFDEFYPHDIVDKDIVGFKYTYQNSEGQEVSGAVNFEQNNPIRIGNHFSNERMSELEKILKEGEEIPLDVELIKNAQDHMIFENYKMATLEIQSAVEYVISKKIRTHLECTESEEHIINILKKRWDDLKSHLKNATSEEIIISDECRNWRQNCAQLRNKVIHRQYTPSHFEANSAVDAGKLFIDLLNSC